MRLLKYSDLAFTVAGNIVAPPLVGILLGTYLDGIFKTEPTITLILVFLGLAAGIRSLFRLVRDIK
jgi:F0F1-type ATP synthase assembly protein I